MNVLDSSGWIALFGEPERAKQFAEVLAKKQKLIVPSVVLFEVCRKIQGEHGVNEAMDAAALMREGIVVDLTEEMALSAVTLCIKHKLPAADGMILATARHYDATLWTMDKDFEGIEGVKYFERK